MSEIEKFDFDGLSERHLMIDPEHGPLVQAHNFIKWAGWANSREAFATHMQDGDWVEISTRSDQAKRGALPNKERWLTKRGVRRLLFRSNHPKAIEYADRVMDLLEVVDKAQAVGIDVVKELTERTEELQGELDMEKAMNQVMHMEVFNTDVRIQEQLAQAWDEGMTQGRYSSRDDRQLYNPYRRRMVAVGAKYTVPARHWTKLQERRMLRQFP